MDEREVVDASRKVRQQVAHPGAALAVLLESERALHQPSGASKESVNLPFVGEFLTVVTDEVGLVVVGVEVADAAASADVDDAFGFRWKVCRLGRVRRSGQRRPGGRASGFPLKHPGEREAAQTRACFPQKVAATEVPGREVLVRG